jgi:hypothetical protein
MGKSPRKRRLTREQRRALKILAIDPHKYRRGTDWRRSLPAQTPAANACPRVYFDQLHPNFPQPPNRRAGGCGAEEEVVKVMDP